MASTVKGFYTSVARKGNFILYRGYDEDGAKIQDKFKFRPVIYLPSKKKETEWKSLEGIPVEPMRFDTMGECKDFTKQYDEVSQFKYWGNVKHIPAFIQSQFPGEIAFTPEKINVCTIDIETDYSETGYSEASDAKNEIVTITLKSSKETCYRIWGMKDFDTKTTPDEKNYRQFHSESAMLEDFVEWWSDFLNTPDVITGWNTLGYDIPYIVNRISRVLGVDTAKRLSPWGMINERNFTVKGKETLTFDIIGIEHLDYLDLFKKFTLNTLGPQESYKLDFIAEVVLSEKKLDYSEYKSLQDLYERNFQKFLEYNIQDVGLVSRLEDKLGLINLVFTMTYMGGVNYTDTLGTTAIWDAIIFRKLALEKIAVPQPNYNQKESYPGGYVKEVQVGLHEWVMSFDLASLYPNLIVQYNMSPETLVRHAHIRGMSPEYLLSHEEIPELKTTHANYAVAANGSCFKTDKQGQIPQVVEAYYNKRVTIKNRMLSLEQEKEVLEKEMSALGIDF